MPNPVEPTHSRSQHPTNPLVMQGLIGVATVPMLVALVGGKLLAEMSQDLGQWSEELFRGDRLPLLKTPLTNPTASDRPDDTPSPS